MVKFPKPGENLVKLIEEAFDMFKYIFFVKAIRLAVKLRAKYKAKTL